MTDRIKSAEDLSRAFQEPAIYGNGSRPTNVRTPEAFGEFVDVGDRKSSIIDLAEMLAGQILPGEAFLPRSFSPETLFDQYSEAEGGRADKLWIIDDANAVLTDWRKAVNGERVATRFLELYDCKSISEHFRRNSDGKEGRRREIPQTSTSLLFGATFNIACFQGQAIREGLARRFLYYVAENHGRLIV